VVNAALDAVRHLGVKDIRMPLTPERVWRALQGEEGGGARATDPTTGQGVDSASSAETTGGAL
jgi:carbon-monoxide dehydrogenase large subunit